MVLCVGIGEMNVPDELEMYGICYAIAARPFHAKMAGRAGSCLCQGLTFDPDKTAIARQIDVVVITTAARRAAVHGARDRVGAGKVVAE